MHGQVEGIEVAGSSASVSALDFSSSSSTLILAIGNECGLVRLFSSRVTAFFKNNVKNDAIHWILSYNFSVHIGSST